MAEKNAHLEVSGLTKRFGGLVAVKDMAFGIGAGKILGLIHLYCTDPHRALGVPSLRYIVQLTAPGLSLQFMNSSAPRNSLPERLPLLLRRLQLALRFPH